MINILPRYRIKIWQIILYGMVVVVGDYFGNIITFNTVYNFDYGKEKV